MTFVVSVACGAARLGRPGRIGTEIWALNLWLWVADDAFGGSPCGGCGRIGDAATRAATPFMADLGWMEEPLVEGAERVEVHEWVAFNRIESTRRCVGVMHEMATIAQVGRCICFGSKWPRISTSNLS
eukprot:TRINITY_DN8529_c0_g1_i3.p1 TRINITY_DN8529_c0_g1~~TRINITY_DN8529_c0_g1_i3.p1  ORF type:complete len:128 (-),score=5.94 TRINITY_DN8529_c0_g1_i3:189-572(-)